MEYQFLNVTQAQASSFLNKKSLGRHPAQPHLIGNGPRKKYISLQQKRPNQREERRHLRSTVYEPDLLYTSLNF